MNVFKTRNNFVLPPTNQREKKAIQSFPEATIWAFFLRNVNNVLHIITMYMYDMCTYTYGIHLSLIVPSWI